MNIRPEDMLKIKKDLEQEQEPQSMIDKALESAELIRENIKAVKGERYLDLVEIGVLINKSTQLNAFIVHSAFDDEQIEEIGVIVSSIHAKTLKHAASLYNEKFEPEDAVELLQWVDRISKAERAGVEQHIEGMMPGNE